MPDGTPAALHRESESDQPCASVVVPLHNSERSVPALFDTLQRQTVANFEVLLVDDGSTDDTLAFCLAAAEMDRRFLVLHQENAGPGVARNTGIDAARGRWVAFLDHDDALDPRFLEHMVDAGDSLDADVVVCQNERADTLWGDVFLDPEAWDAGDWPVAFDPREHPNKLFETFRNWPWAKLFSRDFLAAHAIRFPALYRTEDLAFTCSALATAKRIALCDKALYRYTINDATSSTGTRDAHALDFFDSCAELKAFLDKNGLFGTYAETYTQWVALCCALNLVELNSRNAFAKAYRRLHDGGLVQLGIASPRRVLARRATGPAAGVVTNGDVDEILSIVERHVNTALGLAHLIRAGHGAQLVTPSGLRAVKDRWRHARTAAWRAKHLGTAEDTSRGCSGS